MAQESDFKFVSVEDDDDEIVIQAGATHSAPAATGAAERDPEGTSGDAARDSDRAGRPVGGDAGSVAADGGAGVPGSGSAADGAADGAAPAAETEEEAAERARFERAKAKRQREAEMNRMITTEEDLKGSVPFEGMRRAIVIIAILLIVAFIIYYYMTSM